MKIWRNWNWPSVACGALFLMSVTGCAAELATEEHEEATATTGERVTLNGAGVWYSGNTPVVLGPSSSKVCFLTEVYGVYRGSGDKVEITNDGTNWILSGTSGPTVHGAAARCVNIPQNGARSKTWEWPTTDGLPNELWSPNDSGCYLIRISGNFFATTDYVRTYIGTNSAGQQKWFLNGSSASGNIKVGAQCVRGVMLEASGIRYGGQGLYTIPGLVNADPDGKSPYGCFLTQVGGALNGGFFGQFGVSIMITHPQVIGGWIWRVSVDQPGLGTSAGFGCLQ